MRQPRLMTPVKLDAATMQAEREWMQREIRSSTVALWIVGIVGLMGIVALIGTVIAAS